MIKQTDFSEIEWNIQETPLTQEQIESYNDLVLNSSNVTSASTLDFCLNGIKLLNDLEPIYVLGYQQVDHQKKLKFFLTLVIRTKTIAGIDFKLLQPVSHDHVDMMSILGQESSEYTLWLPSLKKALSAQLPNWHLFSARRLRALQSFNEKMVSQTYLRESAFLNFHHDSGTNKELKEIIPKKLLKNIVRFERNFEKEYKSPLTLEVLTNKKDVEHGLHEFFSIENSGWKGKAGSAIACDEQLQNFYASSWETFADRGQAAIYLLKSGSSSIAAGIAFQTPSEIILHKIAFDESLSKYGPGSIMVKQVIETTLQQGNMESICFNTNPKWLSRWHTELYQLVALQLFNSTFKSLCLSLIFKTTEKLRLVKRKMKDKKE